MLQTNITIRRKLAQAIYYNNSQCHHKNHTIESVQRIRSIHSSTSNKSNNNVICSYSRTDSRLLHVQKQHQQQQQQQQRIPDHRSLSTATAPYTPSTTGTALSTTTFASLWNPTEEHAALRKSIQSFVQKEVEPQALLYNQQEKFNIELFRKLGNENLGILGLTVDEQYGGSGFIDATSVAIVHEELSYSDPAFCLAYLAHSLLLVNNIHINANDEQKQLYLPGCCDGTTIGGMCMSEPDAGTDVLGMKTSAVQQKDTCTGDWIINGTKMWITNGTLDGQTTGDLFLVYAKTGPSKFDVTQFIIEKNTKGFTLGQQIHNKLGMRASMTAELVFDNVVVSNKNVVGGANNAVGCMMRNLEIERIGLAAMGVGIARRALDEMKNYAITRKAFDKELVQFGQIQKMIADSYVEYMAGKSYLYTTAQCIDITSSGNTMDSDGVKLYCSQMSKTIADRAIQVLGGNGYIADYVVERLWRDAKLLEIGGGTNESHHKNICRDILRKLNTHTQFQ